MTDDDRQDRADRQLEKDFERDELIDRIIDRTDQETWTGRHLILALEGFEDGDFR